MQAIRTFEEVFQQYLGALANSGSGLTVDTTQGSFAYTLGRAAASVSTLQDQRLQSLALASNPATAKQADLDALGSGYQILRGEPQVSSGYCLAISTSSGQQTLAPNTLLVNQESGLQYYVASETPLLVPTFTEIRVPLRALQPGQQYNALASTSLFCPTVPNLLITIGGEKLDSGDYYGDLTGGQDAESDAAYRVRILNRSEPYSTQYLVQKLLELSTVNRAFVSTAVGGILEVWVDSVDITYTQPQLDAIRDYIKVYCSPGIIPVVIRAKRRTVNIVLDVKLLSNDSSLDSLTESILSLSNQYVDTLSVNDSFVLDSFITNIRPLVRSVKVLSPLKDIEPLLGEVLVLGSIEVSYPAL